MKRQRLLATLAVVLAGCGTSAVDSGETLVGTEPESAAHHDISPPLYLIPPAERLPPTEHEVKAIPRHFNTDPTVDAALQPPRAQAFLLAPTMNATFDGVSDGFVGPQGTFTVNSAPPDTNGDVGPNHYVQSVNTDFAVFDKTGTVLYGPVATNTLWSGFGGGCQTQQRRRRDGRRTTRSPTAGSSASSRSSTTPYLPVRRRLDRPPIRPAPTTATRSRTARRSPTTRSSASGRTRYYMTLQHVRAAVARFAGPQGLRLRPREDAHRPGRHPAVLQQLGTDLRRACCPSDLDGATPPPAGRAELSAWRARPNVLSTSGSSTSTGPTPANSTFTGPTSISGRRVLGRLRRGGTLHPAAGARPEARLRSPTA